MYVHMYVYIYIYIYMALTDTLFGELGFHKMPCKVHWSVDIEIEKLASCGEFAMRALGGFLGMVDSTFGPHFPHS